MDKRGSGFTIFRRNFFVSQCRNISWGNRSVLCFRNFPVAKKLMDMRGMGEYQGLLSKIFLLTVSKSFVGESFSVS